MTLPCNRLVFYRRLQVAARFFADSHKRTLPVADITYIAICLKKKYCIYMRKCRIIMSFMAIICRGIGMY